jgi:tetratricopeptide (TPR) repeat protein
MIDKQTKEEVSENLILQAEKYWSQSDKTEQNAKETIGFLDRAINLNPLNFKAWADKGFILQQLGDLEGALLCLDRSLALNEDFINSLYNKGIILGVLGRFKEAINCMDEVLKRDPNHDLAFRDRNVLQQIVKKII